MTAYEPSRGFLMVFTALDLGETSMVITDDAAAAEWARRHGYRVMHTEQDGISIYEIHPGDSY
ncbi:hypothetical protein HH310_29785 [Actinoplanes sp. TBRC 11911]|uniref:hypothetical protein n=1 Tax=Actinoplanes sp. TBRC 11911 TaxID=2729386 RepID=UPI00145F9676|nr:hypothetical protein [Actinoplanes sp. TBRC 11911]NMO55361.1 hypothetical protein [Actinoplanes sp. TBRC 11911]